MKLEVPYYSQWRDVKDKDWMSASCAIVCTKMVLDFFKVGEPGIDELITEGYKNGGYGKYGWFHDYQVFVFKKYGLSAHREEKMMENGISKLKESLDGGNPVIVSVIDYLLERTKFHQVVLVGYEMGGKNLKGFYYHDPATTSDEKGAYLFCPLDKFLVSWRKMAIFAGSK